MSSDFRGSGWRFPIEPDSGALTYVEADENVAQSVELVVRTFTNERVMRGDFGTSALELLFEPTTDDNLRRLELAIGDAIRQWEPRVELEQVEATVDTSKSTMVRVSVDYVILRTNTKRNLVFPFYDERNFPT